MRKPHLERFGEAFVADNATIVGAVHLAKDVSVWYGVVIRGDVASITIGEGTNVQDLACIHPQHDENVVIGRDVTIGHGAIVHGLSVGDGALIGMGAILLPGSRVGAGALVAAGAVVTPGATIPDGMLAVGSPAKVVRPVRDSEKAMMRETVERYAGLVRTHLADS